MRSTVSLPDELIMDEIVARLPAKTAVRLKTVCRRWLSTISSPEFAKSHLAFASSRQVFLLDAGPRWYKGLYLLPYNNGNDVDYDYNKCLYDALDYGKKADLVGCCNGIMCLYQEGETHEFALWNPATHEYEGIDNNPGFGHKPKDFNFCYVSCLDDYKIVVMYSIINCVYIFSMKRGTWNKVVISNLGWEFIRVSCGYYSLFFEKKIYWIIEYVECGRKVTAIVAINLVTEQWEEFTWMNWLSHYNRVDLFVLDGRLAFLCRIPRQTCADVWRMECQDDWNSWNKFFTVDLKRNAFLLRFIHAAENHKYLFLWTYGLICLIDPTHVDDQRVYCVNSIDFTIDKATFYFDTLISPGISCLRRP